MDRPRSLDKDAGRWVRSIQPLGGPPVAKHEERGRLPLLGETTPLVGAYSIVIGGLRSRPVAAAPCFGRRASVYRRFTGCSNRAVMTGNS